MRETRTRCKTNSWNNSYWSKKHRGHWYTIHNLAIRIYMAVASSIDTKSAHTLCVSHSMSHCPLRPVQYLKYAVGDINRSKDLSFFYHPPKVEHAVMKYGRVMSSDVIFRFVECTFFAFGDSGDIHSAVWRLVSGSFEKHKIRKSTYDHVIILPVIRLSNNIRNINQINALLNIKYSNID